MRRIPMLRTYTDVAPKLDAIADNCKPQSFLGLAATARDFITVASWLNDVRDESEFEKAFSRLVGLLTRFYSAVQQAHDMGLLASVDESTRSSPRELRELDKALEYPGRRIRCLVAVCHLAQATATLIGTRRFPSYYFPWTLMFALLLDQPALAGIFHEVDLAKWRPMKNEPGERFAAMAELAGFLRIDIKGCCNTLVYEAGELWTESLTRGFDANRLQECARRMGRLLSFLTLPPQEPWILQEFISIGSMDSMQAVLTEILRHDVRLAAESDAVHLEQLGQYARGLDGLPADVLLLVHGRIRKRKYYVLLPDFQYFVARLSSTTFEEASVDPIGFLRKHWRDAPGSLIVRHRRQWLWTIEAAAVDSKFRDTMEHVIANLAGETFAYAISSSVGTSPEVSIFIAGCFGIAVDVMMSLRKN
jgi:hypothetical protein